MMCHFRRQTPVCPIWLEWSVVVATFQAKRVLVQDHMHIDHGPTHAAAQAATAQPLRWMDVFTPVLRSKEFRGRLVKMKEISNLYHGTESP